MQFQKLRKKKIQSSTEASVSLPGIPSNMYYTPGTPAPRNVPAAGTVNTPSSSLFDTEKKRDLTSSLGGLMQLFQTTQNLGSRLGFSAGAVPLFDEECTDCLKAGETAQDKSSSYRAESYIPPLDEENYHDPNNINKAISEEAVPPFDSLSEEQRTLYTNSLVDSLGAFGSLVVHNVDEYKAMCPNFESLGPDGRKAVMIYMFSEIFKQTTNYNPAKKTSLQPGGQTLDRVGMCQLNYEELKEIYQEDNMEFKWTETEFENVQAIKIDYHMTICAARVFKLTRDVPTDGNGSNLAKAFPTVDFGKVSEALRKLNLCKGSSAVQGSDVPTS